MKKILAKKLNYKVGVLILILLGLGAWLIRSTMVSPQVALISNGGDERATCVSNIATFTATTSCGDGMVNRVDYVCTESGKKGYEGGNTGDCIDPALVYQHAIAYCGQTCTTQTATPQPSCVPNPCPPGAACKLMALPDGQSYCPLPSSPTPTKSDTPYPTPMPSYPGESGGPVSSSYPTPMPPTVCTQVAGTCANQKGQCVSFKNGCEQREVCRTPYTPCTNLKTMVPTPTPTPVTTLTPKPTPKPVVIKPSFAQCFRTCRAKKSGALSCVRYCMR